MDKEFRMTRGVTMRKKIVLGYVYALLSAVIYGCMPLMAKLIYADGVNPMTLSFLRNALADMKRSQTN